MTSIEEKSKGLLTIGTHCYKCSRIDFLPFNCEDCGHQFCSEHSKPEAHECTHKLTVAQPSRQNIHQTSSNVPSNVHGSSSAPGHKLGEAPKSSKFTTTKPISSSSHTSSSPTHSDAKSTAIDKLKNLWSSKKTFSGTALQSKAHIMELNTLKRTAKGDTKVPQAKRIYFYLERPESKYKDVVTGSEMTRPSKKVAVFFAEDMIVGRILDKAYELLEVAGAIKNGKSHGLYVGGIVLQTSEKLCRSVKTGQTLQLK